MLFSCTGRDQEKPVFPESNYSVLLVEANTCWSCYAFYYQYSRLPERYPHWKFYVLTKKLSGADKREMDKVFNFDSSGLILLENSAYYKESMSDTLYGGLLLVKPAPDHSKVLNLKTNFREFLSMVEASGE